MKRNAFWRLIAGCLFGFLFSVGCSKGPIHIPAGSRESNWGPSCAHAAICTVLRYYGQFDKAEHFRTRHFGGLTESDIESLLRTHDIEFESAVGDFESGLRFLQRQLACKRPCIVGLRNFYQAAWVDQCYGYHAVVCVGLSDQAAYLIDSNFPLSVVRMPLDEFYVKWMSDGSWAIAISPNNEVFYEAAIGCALCAGLCGSGFAIARLRKAR
jgi:hypothetical protein